MVDATTYKSESSHRKALITSADKLQSQGDGGSSLHAPAPASNAAAALSRSSSNKVFVIEPAASASLPSAVQDFVKINAEKGTHSRTSEWQSEAAT